MSDRAAIQEFLAQKPLALAGASRDARKFGNAVVKGLEANGICVHLLHPTAESIQGRPCFRDPSALPGPVDGLVVVLPKAQTTETVRQAIRAGIPRVWIQQGSATAEALELCRSTGVKLIHGRCILMYLEKGAWIHRWHRNLWRWLGMAPR